MPRYFVSDMRLALEPPGCLCFLHGAHVETVQGLDNTPLTYIDTEEQLRTMVEKLEGAAEIAVDLEHHAYRTFQGLTCLMQLSDRNEDYIIDVLKLRQFIGPLLAPIFADPQASQIWTFYRQSLHISLMTVLVIILLVNCLIPFMQ